MAARRPGGAALRSSLDAYRFCYDTDFIIASRRTLHYLTLLQPVLRPRTCSPHRRLSKDYLHIVSLYIPWMRDPLTHTLPRYCLSFTY